MSKINPYFEVNGNRYEFKKTNYLVAEYNRLNEESPLSAEDRQNAAKASNLVADVKRYADKEKEWWEKFCDEPTPENQRTYLMFKAMSDNAVDAYNSFVVTNNTLNTAAKQNIDILEKIAIKALAEQYYNGNESLAKQTWEMFVDSVNDHNTVAEWLNAMAECLFIEEAEVEEDSFLSRVRKAKENKEFLRKQAAHKKK